MVQTECFMNQYVGSRIFEVSDEDMRLYEWLHERIRNDYEHFVPKIYLSPIQDLIAAAWLCIKFSKELLFESGNVVFHIVKPEDLDKLFHEIQLICADKITYQVKDRE